MIEKNIALFIKFIIMDTVHYKKANLQIYFIESLWGRNEHFYVHL